MESVIQDVLRRVLPSVLCELIHDFARLAEFERDDDLPFPARASHTVTSILAFQLGGSGSPGAAGTGPPHFVLLHRPRRVLAAVRLWAVCMCVGRHALGVQCERAYDTLPAFSARPTDASDYDCRQQQLGASLLRSRVDTTDNRSRRVRPVGAVHRLGGSVGRRLDRYRPAAARRPVARVGGRRLGDRVLGGRPFHRPAVQEQRSAFQGCAAHHRRARKAQMVGGGGAVGATSA